MYHQFLILRTQNYNDLSAKGTSTLRENWKQVWTTPSKRQLLIIGTIIILIILNILPIFFNEIEKRKGVVLNDWLLNLIPAHNVSVPIFTIIWGMAIFIFIRALNNPVIYIRYCWTLIFVCIVRFFTISMFALDPPAGLLPLNDSITEIFYGHANITKDLFFSGHTSTMVLIFLCLEKRNDKIIAFIAAFLVAVLLLVQHIHYTIDIVAAPIIVYSLYRLTRYMLI